MKHAETSKSKIKITLVVVSFCLFAALAGILIHEKLSKDYTGIYEDKSMSNLGITTTLELDKDSFTQIVTSNSGTRKQTGSFTLDDDKIIFIVDGKEDIGIYSAKDRTIRIGALIYKKR
jgi:hypothetical protein